MKYESEKNDLNGITEPNESAKIPQTPGCTAQSARRNQKKAKTRTNYYTLSLDETRKRDLETAGGIEGLEDEISLLRARIKNLLETDPENLEMLIKTADILNKMVKTHCSYNKKPAKNVGETIQNIITEIGVPLGVAALNKKL
jgi:hypothetical protein